MLNVVTVSYNATNYYVVETDRTRLLVDAGLPGTLPAFRHALQRAGVPLAAIGYLLVTHYHPDHAGLAEDLKQQGIRLVVLAHQTAAVAALGRLVKPQDRYREIQLHDALTADVAQSRALLRRIGIDGEVIATPGHSDDSVSLILDAGMAFTGDLPRSPADDTNEALERSWAAIHARHVRMIYPGHGPAFELTGVDFGRL